MDNIPRIRYSPSGESASKVFIVINEHGLARITSIFDPLVITKHCPIIISFQIIQVPRLKTIAVVK